MHADLHSRYRLVPTLKFKHRDTIPLPQPLPTFGSWISKMQILIARKSHTFAHGHYHQRNAEPNGAQHAREKYILQTFGARNKFDLQK